MGRQRIEPKTTDLQQDVNGPQINWAERKHVTPRRAWEEDPHNYRRLLIAAHPDLEAGQLSLEKMLKETIYAS
jgi:hypothetical protein